MNNHIRNFKFSQIFLILSFFLSYLSGGWIILPSPEPQRLAKFYFLTPDTGFVYNRHSVWKTMDGGISYRNISPPIDTNKSNVRIQYIKFLDDSTGYLWHHDYYPRHITDTIRIWKTTDGGDSWENILTTYESYEGGGGSLCFLNPNYGYVALPNDINIFKTTDGGRTWLPIAIVGNIVNDISFCDTLIGYGIGNNKIWKTTNGGGNWQLIATLDSSISLEKIQFPLNHHTGYISGYNDDAFDYGEGTILKTTNGGYSWEVIFSVKNEISSIFFTNNDTGYVSSVRIGEERDVGKLFKTINGRDFIRLALPKKVEEINTLFFISGTKTGYVSACGQENYWIFKTVDGGGESLGFWKQLTTIPEKPKKGVLLSYVPDSYSLFLLEKGKTRELWCYNIADDSWQTKKPIPVEIKEGSITFDGKGITVLKLKSNECWHYNITNDSWLKLPNIPGETLVKKGGCITSDWDSLLFVLKGGKKNEFWIYNSEKSQWQRKPNIPGIPVFKGASIAADGEYVYAIKGGKTNEFWAYDIEGDSWHRLSDIFGKGFKDGTCLAANPYYLEQDRVLAFKGGSQECWEWRGYWKLIPGIPGKKKIKKGAQLTVDENNNFYAIKGKKMQEIWLTDELTSTVIEGYEQVEISENIQTESYNLEIKDDYNIQISNPVKSVLHIRCQKSVKECRIFDITGKLVNQNVITKNHNETEIIISLEGINPGIYFLQLGKIIKKFLVIR
ncbi:MAG: T9SS type A sorting domain-containing protein [candidate division WOR-3 bacterium]|nr:T9SS type A sorting domain-containing protein [candidate division WOR-3 bacterium]